MSEREGSQRERGATRAGWSELARTGLSEERALSEREGSQRERALSEREGSQRERALSEREGSQRERALSEREGSQRERGATRAGRSGLARTGLSEERV